MTLILIVRVIVNIIESKEVNMAGDFETLVSLNKKRIGTLNTYPDIEICIHV